MPTLRLPLRLSLGLTVSLSSLISIFLLHAYPPIVHHDRDDSRADRRQVNSRSAVCIIDVFEDGIEVDDVSGLRTGSSGAKPGEAPDE